MTASSHLTGTKNMSRVFLVNIGSNSSHNTVARSPLFQDDAIAAINDYNLLADMRIELTATPNNRWTRAAGTRVCIMTDGLQ